MAVAAIDFEPATGTLRANEHVLHLLLTYVTTGQFPPRSAAADELHALHEAGALHDTGELAESLALSLAGVLRPARTAELTVGTHRVRAWTSPVGVSTLLTPLIGDPSQRHKLVRMPASLLPESLARLVDLGPRPIGGPGVPVPFDQNDFSGIRRRWRLVTGRAPATGNGQPHHQHLDVLDTEDGLWLLDPDATHPTATPSTASEVWRLLVRHTVGDSSRSVSNR